MYVESAAKLFTAPSSRTLGAAVAAAVAAHSTGAAVCIAVWARDPGALGALVLGLGFFLTALALWRMLAWARRVSILALGLALAGLCWGQLLPAVLGTGPAPPPGTWLATGVGAWTLWMMVHHRASFHGGII